MLLAFIPARGGSKGVPRKNLAPLRGKPLIQYTLEAALGSSLVDEVLLSTDDEEIAAFCRAHGVATNYRRPADLAGDSAPMLATLLHGLRWFRDAHGRFPDEVLLLQPTSPLRTAMDIDSAVGQFRRDGTDTLLSVHALHQHPCECVVGESRDWSYLVPPPVDAVRRQDYSNRYYYINGAIYVARSSHILSGGTLVVPGRSALYEMPAERGVDIDTPLDLSIAEALIQRRTAA